MDGAKPSVGSCELPTGILFEEQVLKDVSFREMTGIEEDILAQPKGLVSKKMSDIIGNCIQKVGPVEDRLKINQMIDKFVTSDRFLMLIQLRMLSVGQQYEFTTVCPECHTEDKVNYDLNQVKIEKAPDARALYHEVKISGDRTVRWKVMDGVIESKNEKMANEKNAMTVALFNRITEIDGLPPKLVDVVQMPLRDRNAIRKEIDIKEGKLDDEYETTCPKCGHTYKGELSLEPVSFFFP